MMKRLVFNSKSIPWMMHKNPRINDIGLNVRIIAASFSRSSANFSSMNARRAGVKKTNR